MNDYSWLYVSRKLEDYLWITFCMPEEIRDTEFMSQLYVKLVQQQNDIIIEKCKDL